MNYCEQCKVLTDTARCPLCKSKKLRAPREKDYCFFTECDEGTAILYRDVLAQDEIRSVAVPSTTPVGIVLGMFMRNFKLFVPYSTLDRAKELCDAFTVAASDETTAEE